MAKSRDGNFIPRKGKPSGAGKEEEPDIRKDVQQELDDIDVNTGDAHIMHPNRNVDKKEEETELTEKQSEYSTYKQQPETLQPPEKTARPQAMPDIYSRNDLLDLATHSSPYSISIFLPTHRSGVEVNELHDMIQFKNSLQQLQQELQEKGLPMQEIESLLMGGFDLTKDDEFWHNQQESLAVFIAPGVFRYVLLPYKVKAFTYIHDTFYISPLMGLLQGRDRFYLLYLTKSGATLYEGDAWGMEEIPVPEMPRGIDDVVHFEEKDDQKLFRTGGRSAGEGANFHGIGAGKPDEKENISMYMDEVDETLWKKLLSTQTIPLLLAGVSYMIPLFRQRSRYRHIEEKHLAGNFDRESTAGLYNKARALMQPYFEHPFNNSVDRYFNNTGNGLTSTIPADVIPACYYARTEILFVQKDAHLWGSFNEQDNQLTLNDERQNDDACMLNAAVSKALQNGATVFVTEKENMPEGAVIAALMRY